MALEIWDQDDGEAPMLQPLLGLRVIGAWVIPPGNALCVRLEGGKFLQAWSIRAAGAGAVALKIGQEKAGLDWRFLDALPQKNREPMEGKRFLGMEGPVLVFAADDGTQYGARIASDRVTWVKSPPANWGVLASRAEWACKDAAALCTATQRVVRESDDIVFLSW
jgi:hypothetical protein